MAGSTLTSAPCPGRSHMGFHPVFRLHRFSAFYNSLGYPARRDDLSRFLVHFTRDYEDKTVSFPRVTL